MLIIHGSKDYRLPETDGIGAFHALQQYVPLSSPFTFGPLAYSNFPLGLASRAVS